MAKSSGTTRSSSASGKSSALSASQQELQGYGDVLKGAFEKQIQNAKQSGADKSLVEIMNRASSFIEKYTSPKTEFVEKEFWKDYYKISNNANGELNNASALKKGDKKANEKAYNYIDQSLDMMKVLAGKYHGVKIYDKYLANFKLKPLSEFKKK